MVRNHGNELNKLHPAANDFREILMPNQIKSNLSNYGK